MKKKSSAILFTVILFLFTTIQAYASELGDVIIAFNSVNGEKLKVTLQIMSLQITIFPLSLKTNYFNLM